jgi:hypothetical protein
MRLLKSRIIYILAGILLFMASLITLEKDYFNWYGKRFFIGKGKYAVAIAIMISGLSAIFLALRKNFKPFYFTTYLKCLGCNKLFEDKKTSNFLCPHCGGQLEELNGFYDRHPEFKEEEKEEIKKR